MRRSHTRQLHPAAAATPGAMEHAAAPYGTPSSAMGHPAQPQSRVVHLVQLAAAARDGQVTWLAEDVSHGALHRACQEHCLARGPLGLGLKVRPVLPLVEPAGQAHAHKKVRLVLL